MITISKETSFKNWTLEKFVYAYDNVEYTFEASGVYRMPSEVALHFAKNLAIRELHKEGLEALPEKKMMDYMGKCLPEKDKLASTTNTFERIDIVNGKSEESPKVSENTTEKDTQNKKTDDDEDDTSDEKNNAGAPKLKGRPRKISTDAQYVK